MILPHACICAKRQSHVPICQPVKIPVLNQNNKKYVHVIPSVRKLTLKSTTCTGHVLYLYSL